MAMSGGKKSGNHSNDPDLIQAFPRVMMGKTIFYIALNFTCLDMNTVLTNLINADSTPAYANTKY